MIKIFQHYKLLLLIKFFLIISIIFFKSFAENLEKQNYFVSIGKDSAPGKIKIFSSLTCPHCASFHTKVVPELKKKYVTTGKVQLIFIDFPLDLPAFNASKLILCTDQKKQIKLLDTIYEYQSQWTNGSNLDEINNNLKKIAKNLGISSSQFDECLNNENIANKILNRRIDGQKKYSIEATPTIIINEKKLDSSASFKNIEKKIKKLI